MTQLSEAARGLQSYLPTFQRMGAAAFGILAQRPEKVQEFMANHGLLLPMLIDSDRSITKRYGVYHPFGLDAFRTARPSAFLIDRDGKIRFMYIGESQADRPGPEAIDTALAALEH